MPEIFSSPKPAENINTPKGEAVNSFSAALKRKGHYLSSFCLRPDRMRFETQGDNEEIILLLRAHPITTLGWVLTGLLLILIPIFLFPYLVLNNFLPSNYIVFMPAVVLVWYLFTFSYLLVSFLLWYFTVSIVTNERIIDIDFINILHKEFSATTLSKVEDVTMKMGGFVSALFDFGNVYVQTAGTNANFEFLAVPHPQKVVKIINDQLENHKK